MQTALVLIVVATGVALYLWKFKKRLGGDEDRPEIIVRNGKLGIETAKDWEDLASGKKWRPNQPNGKSVAEFVVTVKNSQDCSEQKEMRGRSVTISYQADSHSRKIRFSRRGNSGTNEPVLDADLTLKHDNGNRQKLKHNDDTDDRITEVRVGSNNPCACPDRNGESVVVRINMTYE